MSSRRAVVLAVFAAFNLVALLEATQVALGHALFHDLRLGPSYVMAGMPAGWWDAFLRQALSWNIMALLVLLIALLALRFPLIATNWRRAALVHGCVSLVYPFIGLSLSATAKYLVFVRGTSQVTLESMIARSFTNYTAIEFLLYWLIVGVFSLIRYYQLYRQRELRTAQLEHALVQARLEAVQRQLQPHFLFNTLNAICGYALEREHERVVGMLSRLSDMLRFMLQPRSPQQVGLHEELALLNSYLELQQLRLGSRLRVETSVDVSALGARVPALLLQPLVENAIQYAVAPRADGGLVSIRIARKNGHLLLRVQDSGPGFGASATSGYGIGLRATRERLQHLYGARHCFSMENLTPAGAAVSITLPFERVTADV